MKLFFFRRKIRRYDNLSSADGGSRRAEAKSLRHITPHPPIQCRQAEAKSLRHAFMARHLQTISNDCAFAQSVALESDPPSYREQDLFLHSQQPQSHPHPQPLCFLRDKWTMIPVMIASNTAITTMLPQFSLSHSIDASSVN